MFLRTLTNTLTQKSDNSNTVFIFVTWAEAQRVGWGVAAGGGVPNMRTALLLLVGLAVCSLPAFAA